MDLGNEKSAVDCDFFSEKKSLCLFLTETHDFFLKAVFSFILITLYIYKTHTFLPTIWLIGELGEE